MSSSAELDAIAEQLIVAHDEVAFIPPITEQMPSFDSTAAYEVLHRIATKRRAQGWQPVGRKIGFTNRTIWAGYGVDRPMWAHMWNNTVITSQDNRATLSLDPLVQPRIEPEVVFKLRGPIPISDDPLEVLECVEWMAPGFEIVQCHFPGWKFTVADCTAAFGLHAALVVGATVAITSQNRQAVAALLGTFPATLCRDGLVIDRGVGANVLGSPALALAHLARVLAGQPQYPQISVGELLTTGTITDAWSIAAGETWTSDYGPLGLTGLTITFI